MPELPEVETIVRGLDPLVRGRRIEGVWWSGQGLHLGRKVDLGGLRAVSVGRAIAGVRRRGKYILVDVASEVGAAKDGLSKKDGVAKKDSGAKNIRVAPKDGAAREESVVPQDAAPDDGGAGIILHLGMTGRLRVQPKTTPRAPHTHVVFTLAGGDELRFVDARRFGWVTPGRPIARDAALAALGPDPLTELDTAALAAALRDARTPIKAFLLDQRRIAGLGNIYVAEALFRFGAHPATPAKRLARRAGELLAAVRASLESGIARRGTTLRDYVDADGQRGDNAAALLVYGRQGEACPRCGAAIRRRVDGGRASFFCPHCQRR
jgi:formamidopyrimidine-DNA glycosylase